MTEKYKVKKIYVNENYANNLSRNYVNVNRLTSGSICTEYSHRGYFEKVPRFIEGIK
jgi:hypothetical protein